MDNFPVRLKKARTEAGLTQPELAERLRVTKQAVANWEQGVRTPSWAVVQTIAAALGIDPGVLGEVPVSPEPPTKPPPKGRPSKMEAIPMPQFRTVRVVGTVGAGPATDEVLHGVYASVLNGIKGEVVGYMVRGDSMIGDHILDGDVVVVRADPRPRSGEMVVAWVDALNGMVLKKLKGRNGYQWLESDDGFARKVEDEDKIYGAYVGSARGGLIR